MAKVSKLGSAALGAFLFVAPSILGVSMAKVMHKPEPEKTPDFTKMTRGEQGKHLTELAKKFGKDAAQATTKDSYEHAKRMEYSAQRQGAIVFKMEQGIELTDDDNEFLEAPVYTPEGP